MNFSSRIALAVAATVAMAGIAHAVPTPEYVAKAGASDLYEITSSKLVTTSPNPKLKRFATMMVTDHNKSTAMVKAAAMKSGLRPRPPMLDAKQRADVAALRAAHGAKRDSLYITQQKMAHQDALALQKDYSTTGDAAPLRAAAGKIVPVVEHHIAMLEAM